MSTMKEISKRCPIQQPSDADKLVTAKKNLLAEQENEIFHLGLFGFIPAVFLDINTYELVPKDWWWSNPALSLSFLATGYSYWRTKKKMQIEAEKIAKLDKIPSDMQKILQKRDEVWKSIRSLKEEKWKDILVTGAFALGAVGTYFAAGYIEKEKDQAYLLAVSSFIAGGTGLVSSLPLENQRRTKSLWEQLAKLEDRYEELNEQLSWRKQKDLPGGRKTPRKPKEEKSESSLLTQDETSAQETTSPAPPSISKNTDQSDSKRSSKNKEGTKSPSQPLTREETASGQDKSPPTSSSITSNKANTDQPESKDPPKEKEKEKEATPGKTLKPQYETTPSAPSNSETSSVAKNGNPSSGTQEAALAKSNVAVSKPLASTNATVKIKNKRKNKGKNKEEIPSSSLNPNKVVTVPIPTDTSTFSNLKSGGWNRNKRNWEKNKNKGQHENFWNDPDQTLMDIGFLKERKTKLQKSEIVKVEQGGEKTSKVLSSSKNETNKILQAKANQKTEENLKENETKASSPSSFAPSSSTNNSAPVILRDPPVVVLRESGESRIDPYATEHEHITQTPRPLAFAENYGGRVAGKDERGRVITAEFSEKVNLQANKTEGSLSFFSTDNFFSVPGREGVESRIDAHPVEYEELSQLPAPLSAEEDDEEDRAIDEIFSPMGLELQTLNQELTRIEEDLVSLDRITAKEIKDSNSFFQLLRRETDLLGQKLDSFGKLIDSKEIKHSRNRSSSDASFEDDFSKLLPLYTRLPERFSLADLDGILTPEMRKSLAELAKLKAELEKLGAKVYLHGSFETKCYACLLTGKNLQAGDIDVVVELPKGLKLNDLLEKVPLENRAFGFERVQSEFKPDSESTIPQSCNFVSRDKNSFKVDLIVREAGYIPNWDPFDFSNGHLDFVADEKDGIHFFPDKSKLDEITENILASRYPVNMHHPFQRNVRHFIPRFAKYLVRYDGEMEMSGYFYDNNGRKWNLYPEDLDRELINYFRNLFECGMTANYWQLFSGMEKIVREGNFTHPAVRKIIVPFCAALLAVNQEPGQFGSGVILEDVSEELRTMANNMATILQSYFEKYPGDAQYFKLISDQLLTEDAVQDLGDLGGDTISDWVEWLKKSVTEKLSGNSDHAVLSPKEEKSLPIRNKETQTAQPVPGSPAVINLKENRASYLQSSNPHGKFHVRKSRSETDVPLKLSQSPSPTQPILPQSLSK